MKPTKTKIPQDVTLLAEAPVEQYLTFRMSRVNAKLIQQASRTLYESAGLTIVAWRLLVIIQRNGPCTFTEANRDIKMDKGQVSRTVSRMLADGLLISEAHESDHRQQYLRLSETGLELYRKAEPVMLKRRRYLLSRFSPEELSAFLHGLDLLDDAAERTEWTQ